MKVPIMYKSSERYKAGTDIIYDDGSKLQYPPFIYAITESGDSGGGDDDDEDEGEDVMIIIENDSKALDKTFDEIKNALAAGKVCVIQAPDRFNENVTLYYFISYLSDEEGYEEIQALGINGGSPNVHYYHIEDGVLVEYIPD